MRAIQSYQSSEGGDSVMIRLLAYALLTFIILVLPAAAEEMINIESLGQVRVLQSGSSPSRAVIVVSGSEGWKGDVVDLAKGLVSEKNLVLGVDYNSYMNEVKDDRKTCVCGEFGRLALYAERKKGFKQFIPPVVIGKGVGGELAYAAAAQAPESVIGAISLDFCDRYSDIRRMCKGYGITFQRGHQGQGEAFLPFVDLATPWAAVPGNGCSETEVKAFASKISTARVLESKTSGIESIHGMIEEWSKSYKGTPTNPVGFPIVEYPSAKGDTVVVILSGDGGWVSLDRDMAQYLSSKGVAVAGLDMQRYLWNSPSPEQGGADLDKLISYYLAQWKKKQALLVGYSMGADALAYMVPRMPKASNKKVQGVVLIGPALQSEFALPVTNKKLLAPPTGELLFPFIKKIIPPVYCIGGSVERFSLCHRAKNDPKTPKNIQVELVVSGHGFNQDHERLANMISDHFGIPLSR